MKRAFIDSRDGYYEIEHGGVSELPSWIVGMTEVTPVVREPTPEEIQQAITAATQQRLDDFARTRGYDGIMSACTYATSTNAKFAAEGQYCVGARDATWATLYQIMDDVLAGTRPMPTGYADIEPEVPALVWPV